MTAASAQAGPLPAVASAPPPAHLEDVMPLTSPARSTLSALQDNWLQWDSAFLRGEETAAKLAVGDLLQAAGELGMSRLPEACFAMLARASQSANDGNTVRARWALGMAEQLDPGRPEVAFASAAVAWHEGRYLAMIGHELRGYARLGRASLLLRLTAENLLVWGIAAVVLSGALYVALQLAAHGAALIGDIAEFVSRARPVTTSYLVALVVVVLPALVPAAWIAIPFYWAILLAPYARPSERAVVGTVIAVLVGAPFLLSAQVRRVAVELSDPMEAARSLQERRLYGGLINDVEALHAELRGAAPAVHLAADLHQDLGQTEYARLLYQRLLEMEPLNAAAHNNLGAYYLRRRETSQAIDHLERAAAIDPGRIEPHRNLWVLYRDYLAFEEAERVLARVRQVAPDRVSRWFSEGPSTLAVMRDGYARDGEVRGTLRASYEPKTQLDPVAGLSPLRLFIVGAFLATAGVIAVLLMRHRVGGSRAARARSMPSGRAVAWAPGLPSLLDGRGWRAFCALLAPVAILLLPRMTALGYRLPWGFNPGASTVWVVSITLLLLYLAARALIGAGRIRVD
ncbi:MAG TPA: tetratricopeptide repeat protein [Thermoanaerobaculia bacterium]|nr:tetratricopeptide repeat protein [Thermoanaerobaculia bacterium]